MHFNTEVCAYGAISRADAGEALRKIGRTAAEHEVRRSGYTQVLLNDRECKVLRDEEYFRNSFKFNVLSKCELITETEEVP